MILEFLEINISVISISTIETLLSQCSHYRYLLIITSLKAIIRDIAVVDETQILYDNDVVRGNCYYDNNVDSDEQTQRHSVS